MLISYPIITLTIFIVLEPNLNITILVIISELKNSFNFVKTVPLR